MLHQVTNIGEPFHVVHDEKDQNHGNSHEDVQFSNNDFVYESLHCYVVVFGFLNEFLILNWNLQLFGILLINFDVWSFLTNENKMQYVMLYANYIFYIFQIFFHFEQEG